jgi:Cu-Zn family superoxide dismutase
MMRVACLIAAVCVVATSPLWAEAMSTKGHAIADIVDAQGQTKGRAMVMQGKDGIHVTVQGVGLTPGVHAVQSTLSALVPRLISRMPAVTGIRP